MRKLALLILIACVASCTTQTQKTEEVSNRLPRPAPEFNGVMNKTFEDSKEDYPQIYKSAKGAPNIIVVLLDDVGFGQPGTTGGPIPTPAFDKLAAEGLTYTQFHTTGICSPTRAALLTGRNHHQTGFGTISELSTGYPGYNGIWGKETASVAEVLSQNGYSTAAWGKWHNTPEWETSNIGPFDRWPTGFGFEYFYGFIGAETSQWEPQLYRNTIAVETDKTPEEGYHLTEDLSTDAIEWIQQQKSLDPEKPYFAYFATGASHAPLHAPQDWIDKFKGQFDEGWDVMREHTLKRQIELGIVPPKTKLTSRPESIPAWEDQTPEAKKVYARQMEVFAAFLAHTDHWVGNLVDKARALPGGENTMVIYIAGDNGSSAEGTLTGTLNNMMTQNGFPDNVDRQLAALDEIGGPEHYNHFAVPWAWAGSAPFQWMKRAPSHFGGTRNGMVISWPAGIESKNETRTQFHHAVDIVPTIYQAAGIENPSRVNGVEQSPMAGVSMNYTFEDASAASTRQTQYFETGGHRAIYHDGWVAASFHGEPWELTGSVGFKDNKWELYNITDDFSQANDLASNNPEKLEELKGIFDSEAKKYNVYPLDDRFAERAINPNRPSLTDGKTTFRYYPGTVRIPEGAAPHAYSRSHSISTKVKYASGDEGVLVAIGGVTAGYSLFIQNGELHYSYNFFNESYYDVKSTKLPEGELDIKMVYAQESKEYGGGGTAILFVNGKEVGKGPIDKVVTGRFTATETMDIGMDLGSAVTFLYKAPYAFTGNIEYVQFDLN